MKDNFYSFYPDFSHKKFLVTGGAGFIGSHLIGFLIRCNAAQVVVLDNLSTGFSENVAEYIQNGTIRYIQGDIADPGVCEAACEGIDVVIHLAALGSVPRSIANPLATHEANSTGFLNMLWAASSKKVNKFIYASSSSVYGDNLTLPKREGEEGNPLSPYAFTKQSNEAYARLFSQLYGLSTIGLRFFNVFGPRQNKDGPYAAVIPLVIDALLNNTPFTMHGDGLQSRDFTHVSNAVWAIKCAIESKNSSGKVYNIACGASTSLREVIVMLEEISGKKALIQTIASRSGDIKDSLADIALAQADLGFEIVCHLKEGLQQTFGSYIL